MIIKMFILNFHNLVKKSHTGFPLFFPTSIPKELMMIRLKSLEPENVK